MNCADCWHELCRLDVTFTDPALARLEQTEVQIQLGPLSRRTTFFTEPGDNQLNAYFATGDTPIPPLPSASEDTEQGGA